MEYVSGYDPSGVKYVQSDKTGLQVPYRTNEARDYMHLLNYSSEVTFYLGLPVIVLDEGNLVFRPDFAVLSGESKSIVVCLSSRELPSEADLDMWEAAARWCERRGYEFRKIAAEELYAGYRVENLRQIELFAGERVTGEEESLVLKALRSSSSPLSVLRLIQELHHLGFEHAIGVLMNMVYRHKLTIPLDEFEPALNTPVSLPTSGINS